MESNALGRGHKVSLLVYDLSRGLAKRISQPLLGKQLEGIWHTSVCVFGYEYYFSRGICRDRPQTTPYGTPVMVHDMGSTKKGEDSVMAYLYAEAPKFTQGTYHVLDHNCNNFSDQLCRFLVGRGIPSYITDLPQEVLTTPFGQMIRPMIDQAQQAMQQGFTDHQLRFPSHPLPSASPHVASANESERPKQTEHSTKLPLIARRLREPVRLANANVEKIKQRMSEYAAGANGDTVNGLLAALQTVEPSQAYPMLDLLRVKALQSNVGLTVANAVPALLKIYCQPPAPPLANLMALRCVCNVMASEQGSAALLATANQIVVVDAVADGLAGDNEKIREASTASAHNIIRSQWQNTAPGLTEEAYIRLLGAVGEALTGLQETAPDCNQVSWLLCALGAMCHKWEGAKQLALAMDMPAVAGYLGSSCSDPGLAAEVLDVLA